MEPRPPSALEAQLRKVTESAARGESSRQELQEAARALVRELRAANEPPEQMLLRVKEILAEAGLRPAYASTDLDTPVRSEPAIYRSVIEWSIRFYYGDDDDGPSSSQGATS